VQRKVIGEDNAETLYTAQELAVLLSNQGKYSEAAEILQATLAARSRILGIVHPDTLETAARLEYVRSQMRGKQPTKREGKAAARLKTRISAAASHHKVEEVTSLLSPTALAEAERNALAAEEQLLAQLALEEAGALAASLGVARSGKDKANDKAKGKVPLKAKGKTEQRS
jgi:hypothetical protein